MIAIVDYGVGNLFSLKSSFATLGQEVVVTADPKILSQADKIVLPGVGAFADAMAKLRSTGLDETVKALAKAGKPLLGICLGMQLLFEKSHEYGVCDGLGLLRGEICPIKSDIPDELKVPHMGWNSLHFVRENPLFRYVKEGEHVYFVHSYYAKNCSDSLVASTEYGAEITAAVACGNIYGCQFHPEKSGETGLKILKAFCEETL